MIRWIVVGLVGLVGCVTAEPPQEFGSIPLRNPTAPFASQTNVTASELAGDWAVRRQAGAAFGGRETLAITVDAGAIGLPVPVIQCSDAADLCESVERRVDFAATGPGRWGLAEPGAGDTGPSGVWVLWADTSRRTVVLGDPDGSYVLILDRAPSGGADRLTAAAEIMDWYGYDLTRLEPGQ